MQQRLTIYDFSVVLHLHFIFFTNNLDLNYFLLYARDTVRALTKEENFLLLQFHAIIHQMKTLYYSICKLFT